VEFTWPVMLFGFAALPALIAGYFALRRRQAAAAHTLADRHLLPFVVHGPRFRARNLPLVLYLAAIALLIFSSARPLAAVPVWTNRAAVMIAVDTSKSMAGTDLAPSRMDAAKNAVRTFLRNVPGSAKVGLVAFSDYAQILVRPTSEHKDVLEALERLKPTQGTAIGNAVLSALRALPGRQNAGQDLLQQMQPQPGGPGGPGVPFPGMPLPGAPIPQPSPAPVNEPPAPGAIIVISDGVTNLGVNPMQAAQAARQHDVKVYTIGVGTPTGSVQTIDNQLVFVPFDPTGLQQIAQLSGGRYFYPPSSEDLNRVYRELGTAFGWERKRMEISAHFAGGAGVFMLIGALLSLLWYRRVP
jgi:Ca-activated chloride channel family protein